ncbi:hypothetical protein TNCV_2275621 [Trichonephila clavipes]|nr:hypothetical protein TNCV_2275621 [Trichonephila clavipes]
MKHRQLPNDSYPCFPTSSRTAWIRAPDLEHCGAQFLRNQCPEQPSLAVITTLIRLGIESDRDWRAYTGTDVKRSFNTRTQLINRGDWRIVTSQSLGNQGTDVYLLVIDLMYVQVSHTIQDAPVCDAASRVVAAMVPELRVHAASNVIEPSCRYLLRCKQS